MFKKNITPQDIINLLNEALEKDPIAISGLFNSRTFCNSKIAKHKSIQVGKIKDNLYTLGFIGLLNGMVGQDDEGWGCIAIDMDGSKIKKFVLLSERMK